MYRNYYNNKILHCFHFQYLYQGDNKMDLDYLLVQNHKFMMSYLTELNNLIAGIKLIIIIMDMRILISINIAMGIIIIIID